MRKTALIIITLLVGVGVAASYTTVGHQEVEVPETAVDAAFSVVDELLDGDILNNRVFVLPQKLAGGSVAFWHDEIELPDEEGWLVFLDENPWAEWEHPTRCAFHTIDGAIHTWDVTTPPRRYGEMVELSDGSVYEADTGYWKPDLDYYRELGERYRALHPEMADRAGENYALFLSGGADASNNHPRYYNNIAFCYTTLVWVYGYDEDNIYVLMSDGDDPGVDRSDGSSTPTDLDGDGDSDYSDPCVHSYVDAYFDILAGAVGPQDNLFIYTTDHGGGGTTAYLNLWNRQRYYDYEMRAKIDNIDFDTCLVTMGQCHSGGFVDDHDDVENLVISTACLPNELSYAHNLYTLYLLHWTAAVNWSYPGWPAEFYDGADVDADTNDDDLISAYEAYVFADDNYDSSTPMYSDYSGIGEELTLWGTRLDGPFCVLNDYDVHTPAGEPLIPPGGEGEMDVTVENIGGEGADNVTATLSSDDPDITVIDGEIDFGSVSAGGTADSSSPFTFEAAAGAQNPHYYHLTCEVFADDDPAKEYDVLVPVGEFVADFADDMESGENGWTRDTNSLWHLEDYRYHSYEFSWKCGGQDIARYRNNMEDPLYSPLIILNPDNPTLRIWTDYDIEVNDHCYVQFGNEVDGWVDLGDFTDGQQSWAEYTYDLGDHAGELGYLRFLFTSDEDGTGVGLFLDDVEIYLDDTEAELVAFETASRDEGLLLHWGLESAADVARLDVYRERIVDGLPTGDGRNPTEPLNELPLGPAASYFLDRDVEGGVEYRYYLRVTENNGSQSLFGPVGATYADPRVVNTALAAPYPCPADGVVTVEFELARSGEISLAVYDISGRLVEQLLTGEQPAGRHRLSWNPSAVDAGVYFLRLEADGVSDTRRAVISR